MVPTDTAGRILDAAAALFAERGYQATTTRAVAEAAGVNEVTLFRGYGNKQGVLAAVVGRVAARQPGQVIGELGSEPARQALLVLARREIDNAMSDGGLMTRLAFEAATVPEVAELFAGGPQSNLDAVAGFVRERQAGGEIRTDLPAEVIAEAFFSLTSSFVIMRTFLGFERPAEAELGTTVDQLVDLFWTGAQRAEVSR